MIAELVTVLIVIVAVKLALWAAYWLGVLTTIVVATALFWIRRALHWIEDRGTYLGAIVPARYFFPLSDITIDLPDDVPILVQVFMLWLAVRSWTTDTGGGT